MASNDSRRGANKRAHGKTNELHGERPTGLNKLNLVNASVDEIKSVVNQVSNERADSIWRYMQFTREDGKEYGSVREFLSEIPGFGPKLINAFETFCYLDYNEPATEAEARGETRAEA